MTCQDCQDLLPLYAAAALDPAETAAVRAHLATGCPDCAGELAAAEATLHKLPLALPLQPVPESAWENLESRIALKEQVEGDRSAAGDRAALAAPFASKKSNAWLGWAAAAAIALVLALGIRTLRNENQRNKQQLAQSNQEIKRLTDAVARNDSLQTRVLDLEHQVKTLKDQNSALASSTDKLPPELKDKINALLQSEQFAVTSDTQPGAGGKLYWNKQRQEWYLYLDAVKPADAGKTYELWIVTADQNKLAAGTAQVDDKGRLTFSTTRKIPPGATLAAVTDEQSPGEPDNGAKGKIHFLATLTN
jgi:hypothetical protein